MQQPNTSASSSATASQPISLNHINIESELKKVNEQMYKKNLELAIRNRTLGILRNLYEIMNTTFGMGDLVQQLTMAIKRELQFRTVSIALINKEGNTLETISGFPDEKENSLLRLRLPLSHTDNFCVDAVTHNHTRLTNDLTDVFVPMLDEHRAKILQEQTHIQTAIIYPLRFGREPLGVLIIGMEKHVGGLSRAERETLQELIEVIAIAIERAQIYSDLQGANARLKSLDKLKDEFISLTSHELRTPMTAIKSYLWMVLNRYAHSLTAKNKEYLGRVYNSTERLINLVNDMLNVSRIESGKIVLKLADFDMLLLIDDVKNEVSARMLERKLELIMESHEKKVMVRADREKIHQVLENLVGNSIKFTPPVGKITIAVSVEEPFAQITVADTGKGIARSNFPKLFQKFGRLENSLESISQNSGTGLGLYICQQFVDLSGGAIRVESEVGQGTKFIFTLPLSNT